MEKFIVKNSQENSKIIELVLNKIKANKSNVLLLRGNLGAGKTTFTYEIAKKLNSTSQVSSPTFVIQKIYNLKPNETCFLKIYHLDLYRLTSNEEIQQMGLFEDIDNPAYLYIIEWPEKIINEMKNKTVVNINIINDSTREFVLG